MGLAILGVVMDFVALHYATVQMRAILWDGVLCSGREE